jgi:malate dehydrogenase (oxaloacetate-decarboxylating)(NADP+)
MDAYRDKLVRMAFHTGLFMKPVFATARSWSEPRHVVFAEGEDPNVLRAVQVVVDEGLARPILVGGTGQVLHAVARAGLRLRAGVDYEVLEYRGPGGCDTTLQAARLLAAGDADALICGMRGSFDDHLAHIQREVGSVTGGLLAAMNALVLDKHTLFLADTCVNDTPSAEELATIVRLAAAGLAHFGLVPKVALTSHSMFGSSERPSARKMREAAALLARSAPDLDVLGEVRGDAALSETIRRLYQPQGGAAGAANLLVMPSLDAANVAFNLLKVAAGKGVTVGPILLGTAKPAHILSPQATVRQIVNMTALAAAQAIAGHGNSVVS